MSQPAPKKTQGAAIWDLVVADMQARDKLGAERYGTRLQANNGRDALQDAYKEALDLTVYLRQAIEERRLSQKSRASALAVVGSVLRKRYQRRRDRSLEMCGDPNMIASVVGEADGINEALEIVDSAIERERSQK